MSDLTDATWSIHLFADCPHCTRSVYLTDLPEFWSDSPPACPSAGARSFTCPDCYQEFEAEMIW